MRDTKLLERIASYASASDFAAVLGLLPDPDPILRKRGADLAIYRDLLSDSHLFACIQSRKAGTLGRSWVIEPPGDVDSDGRGRQILTFLQEMFDNLDVERIMSEILDAPFWGYVPFELMWKAAGDKVVLVDVEGKPPEWFAWTPDGEPRFLSKNAPIEGEEIDERKFVFARHYPSYANPYGERIFSKVFWPIVFKKGGLKFWFIFTEKYGMPWVVLKHPRGAGDDEIGKLLTMGVKLIQDAVAAIPDDTAIDLKESPFKASSAAIYEKLKDTCNAEISKAVLGQTLTTEIGDKGSKAAATVHLEIREDIVDSGDRLVEATMDRFIARSIAENFDAAPPYPRFRIIEDDKPADANERENIKTAWQMGVPIGVSHPRERFRIPAPKPDDETLPPPPTQEAGFAEGAVAFAERQPRRRRPKYPSHIETAARARADDAYEKLVTAVKRAVDKCRSYEGLAKLKWDAAADATRELGTLFHGVILHGYLQGRADVADDMRSLAGQESFAEGSEPDFVKPESAIKYFQNKVPLSPEEYERLSTNMRHYSFTMAGVERNDLLAGVMGEAGRAMEEGRTFAEFKAGADELFYRLGVTRANDFHLETVFVNNLSGAYNAGLYDELHDDVARDLFPYLRYRTMRDGDVRPAHRAIDSVVLPRDDPFWDSNWPLNGHR